MVQINKIYTRQGDGGETHLAGGARIAKDSLPIEVCGELEELNCWLGTARTLASQSSMEPLNTRLGTLQNELFDLGAELSLICGGKEPPVNAISDAQIQRIEDWIDAYTDKLPTLKSFVLPGGDLLNATLHLARAVCRRAERRLCELAHEHKLPSLTCTYLNRLSDLLFAMARHQALETGTTEYLWEPRKNVCEKNVCGSCANSPK
ncbi:MAG: cob(I)yrinic acid a,c-diamide adenosyltransferase [Deltaproteobacteria bacterium]|nr:cob(I)yrinic acid a,c-diamide adenosyltransferase [Deltaproteobacteria bacterium]